MMDRQFVAAMVTFLMRVGSPKIHENSTSVVILDFSMETYFYHIFDKNLKLVHCDFPLYQF